MDHVSVEFFMTSRSRSAGFSILRDIPFTVIVVHDSGATSFGDGDCAQAATGGAVQRRVVQYGDDGVVVLWRRLPVASSASL